MAEALLACCPGDQKPEILAQLKDIKAQWEETVTYMTHCHSRIEWVWLHWSEYLLARDEFYRWFQKMMVTLEPHIELQLGLKEKQWQLSHAQVLLHNVDNQAVLLDRLLEEAASLFNRIEDPSVDEDAQKRMKAEYDAVKAKAQSLNCPSIPLLIHLLINPATPSPTHSLVHLSTAYSFTTYLPTICHNPLIYPAIHPPANPHLPTIHSPTIIYHPDTQCFSVLNIHLGVLTD
ncbi:Nesprin-3 [Saguinus oedipus]|uniref:Nesprin-3 n=1 Tax=Saguinus oedipus TaxID=9490 RepID=A0ABQ9V5Q5_SAGOE|nr:Nesprin-3 [Saguinus oedipus]